MLFTDTFALSNLAYMASVLTLIVMLSLAMLSRAYRPVCVLWVRLLLAAAAIWLFLWPLLGFLLYMVRPD
ncbi:MAG: hypothetical protein NXI24_11010 [bacterium]|nr:hypothetical protein [bacterium]